MATENNNGMGRPMGTQRQAGQAGQPMLRQQSGAPGAARMGGQQAGRQGAGGNGVRPAAGAAGSTGGQGKPGSPKGAAAATADAGAGAGAGAASKRTTIIVVLGVIIAALAVWLLIWIFACNGPSMLDGNARDGQAPYKSDAEIQAELNRQVEEGMFNISIASVIQFDDGTSEGTAFIENVPGNHYNMQVTITDDASGETLYESGILKPNQFIENIALTKDLEPGTYDATATFTALDGTTYDEVGKASAKVTLNVLG